MLAPLAAEALRSARWQRPSVAVLRALGWSSRIGALAGWPALVEVRGGGKHRGRSQSCKLATHTARAHQRAGQRHGTGVSRPRPSRVRVISLRAFARTRAATSRILERNMADRKDANAELAAAVRRWYRTASNARSKPTLTPGT